MSRFAIRVIINHEGRRYIRERHYDEEVCNDVDNIATVSAYLGKDIMDEINNRMITMHKVRGEDKEQGKNINHHLCDISHNKITEITDNIVSSKGTQH